MNIQKVFGLICTNIQNVFGSICTNIQNVEGAPKNKNRKNADKINVFSKNTPDGETVGQNLKKITSNFRDSGIKEKGERNARLYG